MSALPAGLVTFMFTDIEASTRLHQRLGDRFAALIAEHDGLLGRVITDHEGTVVKSMGDGLFAAFAEPAGAVRAAIAIQHLAAEHVWPDRVDLRIRIGLHCGAAQPQGRDYVALAVHQAARVAEAAHGGQILMSEAVFRRAGLSSWGPPARTWGKFRLKDFDEPVSLIGLGREDRSPRALPAAAHNVPLLRTSFIGRDADLEQLERLVADPPVLVTLVGPGGVGKTRLAFELLTSNASSFTDGAWAVLLANLAGEERLVDHVLSVLGVHDQAGRDGEDVLLDYLERRHLLLLLDNCEHLADGVAQLADRILSTCRGVSLVASSREPLQLMGERIWRVEPMPIGTGTEEGPATRLFRERAALARPDVSFDGDKERQLVGVVCDSLDGLPLAIELAAARLRHFSLPDLAADLDHLVHRSRRQHVARDSRHRNLDALVDWSYRLLDEQSAATFRRLSVFRGIFGAAEAERVCALPGGRLSTLDALGDLADKSLVVVELADTTRYRMLVTIRQFAFQRLSASAAELEAAQSAHTDWIRDEIAAIRAGLEGPSVATYLQLGDDRYPNIIGALDYAYVAGRHDDLIKMALNLYAYWFLRGRLSEGRRWLLLAADSDATPADSALARCAAGLLAFHIGEVDEGRREAESAVAQLIALDPPGTCSWATAKASHWLGNILDAVGDLEGAATCFQRAAQHGDDSLTAAGLNGMGVVAYLRGDFPDALSWYQQAMACYERIGELRNLLACRYNIAEALVALGRDDEAVPSLEEILQQGEAIGRPYLPTVYRLRAQLAARRQDLDGAKRMLLLAARTAEDVGAVTEAVDLEREAKALETTTG